MYVCKKCNYSTNKKNAWNRHILTQKHLRVANYICGTCNKSYKYPSGLSRHEMKCGKSKMEEHIDELKQTIKEQNDKLNHLITSVNNKPTVTNMQVNLFLNHECRNAMNFQDFIDSLSLSLDDLKYTSDHGYAKGITNIFVKNLKDIKPKNRPIHCSDKNKLEFYVRDKNKWKYDVNNIKLNKGIDSITHLQLKKIKEWEGAHPNWSNTEDGIEEYMNMVKHIMGDSSKEKLTIKQQLGKSMNIKNLIEM